MTDAPSKSTFDATRAATSAATFDALAFVTMDATDRATLDPLGEFGGWEIIAAIKEQCRN